MGAGAPACGGCQQARGVCGRCTSSGAKLVTARLRRPLLPRKTGCVAETGVGGRAIAFDHRSQRPGIIRRAGAAARPDCLTKLNEAQRSLTKPSYCSAVPAIRTATGSFRCDPLPHILKLGETFRPCSRTDPAEDASGKAAPIAAATKCDCPEWGRRREPHCRKFAGFSGYPVLLLRASYAPAGDQKSASASMLPTAFAGKGSLSGCGSHSSSDVPRSGR